MCGHPGEFTDLCSGEALPASGVVGVEHRVARGNTLLAGNGGPAGPGETVQDHPEICGQAVGDAAGGLPDFPGWQRVLPFPNRPVEYGSEVTHGETKYRNLVRGETEDLRSGFPCLPTVREARVPTQAGISECAGIWRHLAEDP